MILYLTEWFCTLHACIFCTLQIRGFVLYKPVCFFCTFVQFVLERCAGAFTHKLWRVKEEILIILQKTINLYGVKQLKVSHFVPAICKLVEDGSGPVSTPYKYLLPRPRSYYFHDRLFVYPLVLSAGFSNTAC